MAWEGGREGGECDCMEFKNVRGSRPGQFNGLKYQRFHQVNSAWAGGRLTTLVFIHFQVHLSSPPFSFPLSLSPDISPVLIAGSDLNAGAALISADWTGDLSASAPLTQGWQGRCKYQ